MLLGPSGSGKSTVALELLRLGASYLGDESLSVTPGTRTVAAYPKPVTLKQGSLEWIRKDPSHPAAAVEPAANGRAQLRGGSISRVASHMVADVIVSVRHVPNSTGQLRRVDPAAGAIALLSDSLDGARMGPGCLEVVAPIVAGASCWELEYSDARVAAEIVANLQPPLRRQVAVPFRVAPSVDGGAPDLHDRAGRGTASGDSVRIIRFDRTAVLHHGASRVLLPLEDAQADSLGRSHGGSDSDVWAPVAELIGVTPRVSPAHPSTDPLAFGLPGRPVCLPRNGPPLSTSDVEQSVVGQCSGVVAAQVGRAGTAGEVGLVSTIRDLHRGAQFKCAGLERELATTVGLLRANEIEPIVMGAAVNSIDGLLPECFRDFDCIDLLISPSEANRCASTVSGLTTGEGSGIRIRDRLVPGPFGSRIPAEELRDCAEMVRISGRWYRSLHPIHRFLQCGLDLVLRERTPPLALLRDMAILAPRTPSELEETRETAERWGVGLVVAEAVRVCDRRFRSAIAPEVVEVLGVDRGSVRARFLLLSYRRGRWSAYDPRSSNER